MAHHAYCGTCDRCVPCGECVCHDPSDDNALISKLFLHTGWDGRQSLKHSLTDAEKRRLESAIGGEPNW